MSTILDAPALDLPVLPAASRERWQPIRGGLLNLYRYDYEEFRYEQGRLLLRGNNGTGKSRVLALQLPFLLDGDVSPHRLEPDGDPAKRVEWNLLLGTYPDRLGYTWLEFGRRDADGIEHYRTLGCGLHAVAGRGLAGKWLFITSQRVGRDLFLQGGHGAALTRERLDEAIGEHGQVFTSATEYRAAVDRALFGLGPHRYDALVNLLIQLRQPQLSRQLDERRLSAALSEALPPLSPSVIADVADALRGLEADREALEALLAASAGVETFLTEYGRYTQIVTRRRAADVRSLNADYETTMRKLRAAEADRDRAHSTLDAAGQRVEDLGRDQAAAERAVRTLADSDRMRDAHALERARTEAEERTREATAADREHGRADAARQRRADESEAARGRAAGSREVVTQAAVQAGDRAGSCGLGRAHDRACALLALPDGPPDAEAIIRARATADGAVADRRRAAAHLARLQDALDRAAGELRLAKHLQQQVTGQLDEAVEAQSAAHRTLDEATATLIRDYRAWADQVRELTPMDAEGVAWELEHWARAGDGPSPVAEAVRQAETAAIQRLAVARRDTATQLTAVEEQLDDLRAEAERLRAGTHIPPPAPHTRAAEGRATRPGAPLWLLCDFAPDVNETIRAGLEAALEAAGLLDAWVTPDGQLLSAGEHDTVLVVGTSPAPETHLLGLLVPAVDRDEEQAAAVPDETVAAVLRHVGVGEGSGPVWVSHDGRWQAGPLHGAWAKPAAEHLGQGAREAARRRRLAELAAATDEAEQARDRLVEAIAVLDRRRQAVDQEVATAPDDRPVQRAHADIDAAARTVRSLRDQLAAAEEQVAARRHALDAATADRDTAAADLDLVAWVGRLADLHRAVADYELAAAALWLRLETHLDARAEADKAAGRAAEAADAEARQRRLAVEARQRAAAAVAERATLEATVGAEVEQILAEYEAAKQRVEAVHAELDAARQDQSDATIELRVAERDIERLAEALRADARRRQAAVDAFAALATTGLLSVAHPELSTVDADAWSVDRAVRTARRVEQLLERVDSDDLAWQRVQKGIHGHLQMLIDALLPHGYEPSATLVDDLLIVRVPFQGRDCSMTQLQDALADEVAHRQSILDAREREVLENHLIGEVSAHLHDLLRAGEHWVTEVNAELDANPTSTGMKLRFAWRPSPDGPVGLEEARRRLLRAGGTWSSAEREALGAFLQAQIRAVRAANETGTWQEHLAAALDYRAWHHFDVERHQDGVWKRLTRRTHGTGSGGEKAIALTLPQFAAAGAHYRSAGPDAPRLILLDEAFVGIDADMRRKCMGLLAAFDLDFVMTSEREWGCYDTLPGVAIYQLATRPGIDAVGVTRWVWNGRERIQVDETLPPAAAPAIHGG